MAQPKRKASRMEISFQQHALEVRMRRYAGGQIAAHVMDHTTEIIFGAYADAKKCRVTDDGSGYWLESACISLTAENLQKVSAFIDQVKGEHNR